MRRTLKLEESIAEYRVTAEINAPEMYVTISECAQTPGDAQPRADGEYVAREFVEFFNKALASRELMLKEQEADSKKLASGSLTTTGNYGPH